MRQAGASAETIAQARALLGLDLEPPGIAVLPDCWHAVRVFVTMAEQWHWVSIPQGASRRVGLRLESLPVVLAALRSEPHRRPLAHVLPQLLVMQRAALRVWNGP